MAQPLSEDPLFGGQEPEFDPDKIEFRKFGTTRRGYSPNEVRPYLAAIADALRDSQRREGEMRGRLGKAIRRADQAETELEAALQHLAEVEARAQQTVAPDDITDAELTERLGEQVAHVLHSAREAAETRVSQAQLRAREMFEAAEAEATDIRWRAELVYGEKTAEAEAAAEQIITGAQHDAEIIEQEAGEIIAEARSVASELLDAAQVEGEGLIQQSQEARFQILADMDKKRRTMRSQAERLKAGRDRLLQSHGIVQDTLNEIANELRASVAEAKIKGDTAARVVEGEEQAGPEALHSEIADAALIGTISIPEVERYEDSQAAHKAEAFGRTGELADLRGEFTAEAPEDAEDVELVADESTLAEDIMTLDEVVWATDETAEVLDLAPTEEEWAEAVPAAEADDLDSGEAELTAAIEELEASIAEEMPAPEPELVDAEPAVAVVEAEPEVAEPEVAAEIPAVEAEVVEAAAEVVEPEVAAEVADVEAAAPPETREEARIIRVVDPRDSLRVLDSGDAPIADPAQAPPAAEVTELDEASTVDPGAVAALADATGFEVAPTDEAPAADDNEAADNSLDVDNDADDDDDDIDADNPMDSLFDRLRSKRDGDEAAAPASATEEPAEAEVPASATEEPAETEAPVDTEPESSSATASTEADDAAVVAERDAAIGDLQGTIERRLKRVLADEQNHVLETINDRKRKTGVLEAMPPVDTHADMYVAAVVPQIEACYRAGAAFANPLAVVAIPGNGPFVESIKAVIAPIREVLGELSETPEDGDATATVRSFYRTFKKTELAIRSCAGPSSIMKRDAPTATTTH